MKLGNYKYTILSATAVLLAWEFLPFILGTPSYIFPRFSEVFKTTFLKSTDWLIYLRVTAYESLLGFILGSVIGLLTGFLMSKSKRILYILLPYVIASNAIPVIAIAPIIIMWFGNGVASKIAISAFLCFFPLAINTYKGLNNFSPLYQELFKTYGATELQFYKYFRIRNAYPFIFTGLKLNATFSVIGSVVGEMIASDSGLGYGMLQSVYNLNMPRLWGLVSVSCILGILAYSIIYILEKYLQSKNKI
jgi:NitT/TauT family transport system permease protein